MHDLQSVGRGGGGVQGNMVHSPGGCTYSSSERNHEAPLVYTATRTGLGMLPLWDVIILSGGKPVQPSYISIYCIQTITSHRVEFRGQRGRVQNINDMSPTTTRSVPPRSTAMERVVVKLRNPALTRWITIRAGLRARYPPFTWVSYSAIISLSFLTFAWDDILGDSGLCNPRGGGVVVSVVPPRSAASARSAVLGSDADHRPLARTQLGRSVRTFQAPLLLRRLRAALRSGRSRCFSEVHSTAPWPLLLLLFSFSSSSTLPLWIRKGLRSDVHFTKPGGVSHGRFCVTVCAPLPLSLSLPPAPASSMLLLLQERKKAEWMWKSTWDSSPPQPPPPSSATFLLMDDLRFTWVRWSTSPPFPITDLHGHERAVVVTRDWGQTAVYWDGWAGGGGVLYIIELIQQSVCHQSDVCAC